MLNKNIESPLAKILYLGAPLIALLVMAYTNNDPVNAPKALLLGSISFGAISIALRFGFKILTGENKLVFYAALSFLLLAISSSVSSATPIEQTLYGVNGRNTGLVTYVGLVFLLLAASILRQKASFDKIIYGLLFAGLVNFLYNLVVIFGTDPIPWTNPYKTILGTFGNPNFISAFMSIVVSISAVFMLDARRAIAIRIVALVIILISLFEIKKSLSMQGLVASALGLSIVFYFFLKGNLKRKSISVAYLACVFIAGILAIAGMLQKGPLASIIYKRTVSLRGEYWHAGWNMGFHNPWTGLGFDSYGLWYRRMRNPSALINPGPEVITNSSHNVFMDIFSGGGFPLLISYLVISLIVVISIIKIARRTESFDTTFVALTVGWVCYQAQSLISINQIGLAVWGWLFGGALVAYEKASRNPAFYANMIPNNLSTRNRRQKADNRDNSTPANVTLVGFIGLLIGTVVAAPPAINDAKYRSALQSQTVSKIEAGLVAWPKDSYRLTSGSFLFTQNKLNDQGYKYAKLSVAFNPDYFDAWRALSYSPLATESEKKLAAENLHRLDPMNTAYKLAP